MTAFILAVIVNNYNTGQVSVTAASHPATASCALAGGRGDGMEELSFRMPMNQSPSERGVAGAHGTRDAVGGWALRLTSHHRVSEVGVI